MKRIIILALASLFFSSSVLAQASAKKTLEANLNTAEELTKLLTTEYAQVSNLATTLPKGTFVMGEVFCITTYGDEAANTQTAEIEKQFKSFFEKSKWVFGADTYGRPEFGANGSLTVTASGKTETSQYSTSGATFKPGNIIEGIDANISVFQNKKEKNKYIFIMPVSSICNAIFEMEKQ